MEIKNIPQWEWTLLTSSVTVTTINMLGAYFKTFYTVRETGETAPTPLVNEQLPSEAVNMFPPNSYHTPAEFIFEAQVLVDIYVICFSTDNRFTGNARLLVNDEIGAAASLEGAINPKGGIDTNLQDQTTPAILAKFNKVTNSTTLAAEAAIDQYDLDLVATTGAIAGSYIIVFSAATNRFYTGEVVSILGSVLTMDRPLDSTFPIGASVDITFTNMNVDGSGTPVIFGLRGSTPPQIQTTADAVRLIFSCLTDTAINLSLFGDLAKLTRGLLCRQVNGFTNNIFNVKDNRELAGIMFDFDPYAKTNPVQGQDGFTCRLTFGGQSKIGVVIRVAPGEDLQIWIQDDLTSLDILEVMAEGHVVDE